LWPEEFCQWKLPSQERVGQVINQVNWWAKQCPTIATVCNFYPHLYEYNATFKKLYEGFYQNCSLVLHFSPTSLRKVREEFSGAQHGRHLVVNQMNYLDLLKTQKRRGPCRKEFGFTDRDFVILIFGALRSWEEIQLITRAFAQCQVSGKRLLMAGRFHAATSSRLKRRWRDFWWKTWLWRSRAVVAEKYIPDEDVFRYVDTADVAIVPRLIDLTSGIPALAMTFGTMVIAPSHGAYPDYLAGTENLIYESGNASSLALALEKVARMDRRPIIERNREVASQWTGDRIVASCLDTLGLSAY
jgi:glycosyltransferase involved in cell wall biosynthesis